MKNLDKIAKQIISSETYIEFFNIKKKLEELEKQIEHFDKTEQNAKFHLIEEIKPLGEEIIQDIEKVLENVKA
jgi:tetrahydromethanopterin S-methyltransferase subunit G